jgi:hypothetical protein
MRRRTRDLVPAVEAAIGYAADRRGNGVAYARIHRRGSEHLLRIPFRFGAGALPERQVGYAALGAVVRALLARGVERIRFGLDDAMLVDDLARRRSVPDAIVLAYVRLRCALNQLEDFSVGIADTGDLVARARAEVALNVAA